jgi:hypothetical protein
MDSRGEPDASRQCCRTNHTRRSKLTAVFEGHRHAHEDQEILSEPCFSPSTPPPGTRPVQTPRRARCPWIADEVWSAWQYWGSDPVPAGLPHHRIPRPVSGGRGRSGARPSLATVPPGASVPPPGTLRRTCATPGQHAALCRRSPPKLAHVLHRLATLINHQGDGVELEKIEAETGPLDRAFLIQDLRSNWNCRSDADSQMRCVAGTQNPSSSCDEDGVVEGLVIFQCRSCGRVYVGGCHP